MQVVLGLIEFYGARPDEKEFVVCLGFFDGVHLGHLKLLKAAQEIKKRAGYTVCVHTYSVPPVTLIYPGRPYFELTTLKEKIQMLLENGADTVAVSLFNQALMQMDGAEFIDQELGRRLNVQHLVVGFDHRFGFQAKTGVEELKLLCAERGIGLTVVEPVRTEDGSVISSSAIKTALRNGDIRLAEQMLGRPAERSLIERFIETNERGGKDA